MSLSLSRSMTACTNEADDVNVPNNHLKVNFGVAAPQSRAIFTGTELPEGSIVGAKLDGYDDYAALTFTATGTGESRSWSGNKDVILTDTKGTLYSFYPQTGAVDITAIPVDMTADDQTDWLYGTPVSNVNEDNASLDVTLNHALANINLTLADGSYAGAGNVTAISVQSDGIAAKGTFNAAQETPGYSAMEGQGTAITRYVTTTLGGTATDIMVVPTGTEGTITFNVTVDGTVYTATSSAATLAMGNSYKYTLTLNSTFMSVSTVDVTPWNSVQKEDDLVMEKLTWDNAPNGVYAVSAEGLPVKVDNATSECIAVALIVNDAPTPQRIMIEKNGSNNTAYGGNRTLYWNYSDKDLTLNNNSKVDGTNNYGYLPKADGTYQSTPNLSDDYTTWTRGALSDFDGKTNTEIIVSASSNTRDMGLVLTAFNAAADQNKGFTDWYIPACGQLALIYLNMNDINTILTKIGGTAIKSGNYWSSTECSMYSGRCIRFENGCVSDYTKRDETVEVRFVRNL